MVPKIKLLKIMQLFSLNLQEVKDALGNAKSEAQTAQEELKAKVDLIFSFARLIVSFNLIKHSL